MFEFDVATDFVAGLSITATMPDLSSKTLNIRELGETQGTVPPSEYPVLYPNPAMDTELDSLIRRSFGGGMVAKQDLFYLVPYRLLYVPGGSERDIYAIFRPLVLTVKAILTATVQNDLPVPGGTTIDLLINSFRIGQTVSDPAGNAAHGADFVFKFMEFIN